MDSTPIAKPPAWNRLLCLAVIVLSLGYVAVSVARIVVIGQLADLMTRPDRSLEVWSALYLSIEQREWLLVNTATLMIFALVVLVIVWLRVLRVRLALTSSAELVRRIRGARALRWVVLAVVALAAVELTVGQRGAGASASDVVAWDQRLMWLGVLGLAIPAYYVWFAISVFRATNPHLVEQPRPARLAFDRPDARPRTW